MKISEKVIELRKEKGLTKNELALKSGLCIATIYAVESGKMPSLLTISKLAKGLECDFNELWKLRWN